MVWLKSELMIEWIVECVVSLMSLLQVVLEPERQWTSFIDGRPLCNTRVVDGDEVGFSQMNFCCVLDPTASQPATTQISQEILATDASLEERSNPEDHLLRTNEKGLVARKR